MVGFWFGKKISEHRYKEDINIFVWVAVAVGLVR